MTSKTPSRRRRILAPLATLAVAGALVVGSGADFTSASSNTDSVVASGSLTQSNSRANQAIFNVVNIKPGDVVTGSVVITNTGSLASNFSVAETASKTFSDALTMVVTDSKGATVYSGVFGGMGTKSLGVFAAGEARTYSYAVTLAQSATNADQNKTASASYVWSGNQTTAVTVAQAGVADLTTATNANP